MIGLVGLAMMIAITFLYFNELGWPLLVGAWAIVLFLPLLTLVGISGWLVLLVQCAVVGGLYFKAQSGS